MFIYQSLAIRNKLGLLKTNESELAAFCAYAVAFPTSFLALVDTYDTLYSGVPNFCIVAAVLNNAGYQARGVRLDSGDLAYLSRATRRIFVDIGQQLNKVDCFSKCKITASNEINEKTLHSLNAQGHSVDVFGIGTKLVTCEDQPALGCVYKLVEIGGKPRIKLSEDIEKVTIPGRKEIYRLFGSQGYPIVDVMIKVGQTVPKSGEPFMCRHPFTETKRCQVIPTKIVPLLKVIWDGGVVVEEVRSLDEVCATRESCSLFRLVQPSNQRFQPLDQTT